MLALAFQVLPLEGFGNVLPSPLCELRVTRSLELRMVPVRLDLVLCPGGLAGAWNLAGFQGVPFLSLCRFERKKRSRDEFSACSVRAQCELGPIHYSPPSRRCCSMRGLSRLPLLSGIALPSLSFSSWRRSRRLIALETRRTTAKARAPFTKDERNMVKACPPSGEGVPPFSIAREARPLCRIEARQKFCFAAQAEVCRVAGEHADPS